MPQGSRIIAWGYLHNHFKACQFRGFVQQHLDNIFWWLTTKHQVKYRVPIVVTEAFHLFLVGLIKEVLNVVPCPIGLLSFGSTISNTPELLDTCIYVSVRNIFTVVKCHLIVMFLICFIKVPPLCFCFAFLAVPWILHCFGAIIVPFSH